MSRTPTLSDVARAAGVHPGTVSRVLRPETRGLVNAETAARIDEVVARLGYRPNVVARGLRMRQSGIIAAVIPDLTNPLFPPVIRGIEAGLEESGYVALIVNTDNDAQRERQAIIAMRDRQVEGFITAAAAAGDESIPELVKDGVPVVLVNRSLARHKVPAVVPDDRGGTRMALDHVLDLGHRRVAHLAGPRDLSSAKARRRGFEATIKKRDVRGVKVAIEEADRMTIEQGEQVAGVLLDAKPRPTAIVAANDLLAVGAYHAAAARGLDVPTDVSVVGFNDMPFADEFSPPLTTIHVPHQQLGTRAAELLLQLIRNPSGTVPGRETLPVQLVVRRSTATPPGKR